MPWRRDEPGVVFRRLVLAIISGGAVSVEVFLHRRFGVNYLIRHAPLGFFLMAGYCPFIHQDKSLPFILYFLAFLAMCALMQIGAWWRFYRGDNEHSLYRGVPRGSRFRDANGEYVIKLVFEPALVGSASYFICDWNRPLAIYWMFAACCLFLSTAIGRRWQTSRAIMMHDAAIEQQQAAGRFRQLRGEHEVF